MLSSKINIKPCVWCLHGELTEIDEVLVKKNTEENEIDRQLITRQVAIIDDVEIKGGFDGDKAVRASGLLSAGGVSCPDSNYLSARGRRNDARPIAKTAAALRRHSRPSDSVAS